MEKLVSNIILYLGYINKECGLSVSVHFEENVLYCLPQKVLSCLLEYNSHTNPYCIAVKRGHHNKCISHQKSLIKKCTDKSFCCMCHAGVCEYIYPIFKEENAIGFVAISGYREKISPSWSVDMSLWESALDETEIPTKLCDAIIPPLVIMLEQLLERYAKEPVNEYNMIVQFLNEYHNNITLSDLCNHFGRSKSFISHMFKSKCGVTLSSYCNNLKLEDAKKMLFDTDFSVTEIAFDVGFNDVSYFIYLFKKKFGISPFKYRKMQKGEKKI